MPPLIRAATEADLPALIGLLSQLSLDAPREDVSKRDAYGKAFQQILRDGRQSLLVLEDEEQIMGSLALIIVPNLSHEGRPWAVIENLVVASGRRGHGYGRMLIRDAIARARDAGCYKLSLTSNKRRPDAHRFYESLGFRATHEGFRQDLQ